MLKRTILAGAAVLLVAGGVAAQDVTLEQVLQGHYETIGGIEAWQSVRTMKATGRMTMGGGMEAPFVLYAKRPRMQRMEFTFQGMTGIQAFDGETGWVLLPFMGQTEAEAMPADQAEQMREESDFDGPLIGYEEEGVQIALLGEEEVDGTPAYVLEVTMKNGNVRVYYLETEYYLPIKVEGSREQGGQVVEFETILGDYKEVGGLLMAHSIENRISGTPQGPVSQVLTLEEIEVDTPLADSLFVMPGS